MSCTVRRSPEHVHMECRAWCLFMTVCIHLSFHTCAGLLVCLVSPVDGKPRATRQQALWEGDAETSPA